MRIKSFVSDYTNNLKQALDAVDVSSLERAVDILECAFLSNSTVFVCGNGGSAAISDHFMCDHSKCIYSDTKFIPKIFSLPSNMSLLTAIGNDISYEDVFSYQVEMFGQTGDVLIAVSSSGNSPNILKALKSAKDSGLQTIALVGFEGGKAKELADVVIHVPVNNYGISEDAHQALMHILAQYIRVKHRNKVDIKL
jgi:phosphoheptose isomerase